MNDPHVAALRYRIAVDEPYEFSNAPDLDIETEDFTGRLSSEVLNLVPKEHFPNESEIRPIADAFVLAWEVDTGLRDGHRVHFQFQGCDVVDLKPSPRMALAFGASTIAAVGNVTLKAFKTTYPNPPAGFTVTPEVDMLWARYCRYLADREPLSAMAYWCLTLLETNSGSSKSKRECAAKKYDIHFDVLKKLGDLTSAGKGDHSTARKASANQRLLSQGEKNWIESAIKTIIHHLATRKMGITLEMKDLPPL
jgi:hypothetical protein